MNCGGQLRTLLRHGQISVAHGVESLFAPISVNLKRSNPDVLTSSSVGGSGATDDDATPPWNDWWCLLSLRLVHRGGHD